MKSILDESKKAIAIIAFTLALILVICVFFIAYDAVTISEFDTFSNVLNNLTTPLLTFTAIILTFLAFYVQYDFNKKQGVNEIINLFNHSFDLILKDFNYSFQAIIELNNATNTVLGIYNSNTNENFKRLIGTHTLDNYVLQYFNSNIITYNIQNPNSVIDPMVYLSNYNLCRKFVHFLNLLKDELENIDVDNNRKETIIRNFFIKLEITTAPEIINFLFIFIYVDINTNYDKVYYFEIMKDHFGVNSILQKLFKEGY